MCAAPERRQVWRRRLPSVQFVLWDMRHDDTPGAIQQICAAATTPGAIIDDNYIRCAKVAGLLHTSVTRIHCGVTTGTSIHTIIYPRLDGGGALADLVGSLLYGATQQSGLSLTLSPH